MGLQRRIERIAERVRELPQRGLLSVIPDEELEYMVFADLVDQALAAGKIQSIPSRLHYRRGMELREKWQKEDFFHQPSFAEPIGPEDFSDAKRYVWVKYAPSDCPYPF